MIAAARTERRRATFQVQQHVPLGRDYHFLLDLRETADYGGVAEASLASATKAIEKALTILAALQPLLPDGAV